MSRLRLSLIILIYIIGMIFTFNWRPFNAIFSYNGLPFMFFLFVFLILTLSRHHGKKWMLNILDLPAKYWIICCSLVAFILSAFLIYVPLEGIPHVPDDICYVWQARTFAMGQLYIPSHDIPEFFHLLFMVNDGKWYSLFQPGWPALLSLTVPFGLEFILNPILAGVAVALVYPIGRRIFDDRITKFAMFLMALSPMHLAISATQLSHTFSLVLGQIAFLMVFKLAEEDKIRYSLIMGIAVGWLFTTRALNSIAIMSIVSIPLLYFVYKRKIGFTKLLAIAPFAITFLLLQLAYNHAITGNSLYWPQDRYFDISEPKQGCHSLGFGKKVGCPIVHPGEDFPKGFTVMDAFGVLHKRMGTFLLTLFGWQALFLFIGVPFLSTRYGWRKYYLLSVFLSLLVAYFFWYFHGLWGRYYYEACFAVFLLVSAGMSQTNRYLTDKTTNSSVIVSRLAQSFIPALALGYVLFNCVFYMPTATYQILSKAFFNVDARIDKLTHKIPEKSIIFMEDWYQACFIVMRPDDKEKRLCARDLGKHNTQIMQYYPDWHYFRYNVEKDQLTPLTADPAPVPVFIEPEWKIPAPDASGGYAHVEKWDLNNKFKASGNAILALNANYAGAHVAFNQMIFEEGNYQVNLRFAKDRNYGKVKLYIDDIDCGKAVDLYAEEAEIFSTEYENCKDIHLAKGKHKFRFEVTGKNPKSSGYKIGVDFMVLDLNNKENK